MNGEGAPRYSLILVTKNGTKYYYDLNLSTFVMMYEKDKPYKTSLHALDILTANYDSKEQLAQMYNIDGPIQVMYISYNFKGERMLRPVFNNPEWAELARSYGETKARMLSVAKSKGRSRPKRPEIDYRLYENKKLFDEVYYELANLDSDFAERILKNEKRLIMLAPETRNTIIGLRAHERAIRERDQYMYGVENISIGGNDIYASDRYGFYNDLRKCLTNYNEFRTIYLNYCAYKAQKEILEKKDGEQLKMEFEEKKPVAPKPVQKKKVNNPVIPPKQISIFDLE